MTEDSADDREAFLQEMRDVQPIKSARRVTLTQRHAPSSVSVEKRREAAVMETQREHNFLGGGPSGSDLDLVDPHEILEFKRPGVQNGVYRKLRLGKYSLDAHLDLHRLTVEQARQAVYRFVKDCMRQDVRCALITHGKGVGRPRPALLKSCVAHWLPQFDEVLAFHSALKQHGASGATYVLLKKSERKRQDNWERQHKGRS